MTRKEAKAILENDIVGGHVEGNARFMDAFWMAVDALSQEPCDDVVSRQAVLNAIEREDKWLLAAKGHNGLTEIAFSGLKARVDALPSVTHKSGKWIVDGSVDCYLDKVRCHCSECGKKKEFPADYDHIKQELSISYKYPEFIDNYCPNCGANLVEPQESEDKE